MEPWRDDGAAAQVVPGAWWVAALLVGALCAAHTTLVMIAVFAPPMDFGLFVIDFGFLAIYFLPAAVLAGASLGFLVLARRGARTRWLAASVIPLGASVIVQGVLILEFDEAPRWTERFWVYGFGVLYMAVGTACVLRPPLRWPLTMLLWMSPLIASILLVATGDDLFLLFSGTSVVATVCVWTARRERPRWRRGDVVAA